MKRRFKIPIIVLSSFTGGLILFILLFAGILMPFFGGSRLEWNGLLYGEAQRGLRIIGWNPQYDGLDGPYVVGDSVFRVSEDEELLKEDLSGLLLQVDADSSGDKIFTLPLRDTYPAEKAEYDQPEKLIALSDREGDFFGFSRFLQNNGVMDEEFRWTFGEGHLVLNGDFVDRGSDVIPLLWLIYKLEGEAEATGGKPFNSYTPKKRSWANGSEAKTSWKRSVPCFTSMPVCIRLSLNMIWTLTA